MPTSQVSICNLALSWVGGNLITSLQDSSTEAKVCAANFDASRNATLEQRDWTFASDRAIPVRIVDTPAFEYDYQFQLPTNPLCLRVTKVYSDSSFTHGIADWAKEGDRILCNYAAVFIKFVKELVDPSKFSPGFTQAFAARLAADICVPITHDVELFQTYWQLFLNKIEDAGSMDGLQGKTELVGAKHLIRVR
jgi:hypothetical protein